MTWINFPIYATITLICWTISLLFLSNIFKIKKAEAISFVFCFAGWVSLIVFVANLWMILQRPPMRTLGETRLWYTIFLPFIGTITYLRWKYNWLWAYSLVMAMVFLIINLSQPETYSKTLMPALQSPWFVPHVLVYLFAYAVLAASSLVAFRQLYKTYFKHENTEADNLILADNLVYIGFSFLTLGLLFGALWAKEAWGHYWTWDPKETWAFLTWVIYLLYIHFRHFHPNKNKKSILILGFSFVILLVCWFGVNYLPVAKNSVHTYTNY
jgi:ABC-type transport system involved in cytochrome c biogenesis permease subunit